LDENASSFKKPKYSATSVNLNKSPSHNKSSRNFNLTSIDNLSNKKNGSVGGGRASDKYFYYK
jgi:hypothetical protein